MKLTEVNTSIPDEILIRSQNRYSKKCKCEESLTLNKTVRTFKLIIDVYIETQAPKAL